MVLPNLPSKGGIGLQAKTKRVNFHKISDIVWLFTTTDLSFICISTFNVADF